MIARIKSGRISGEIIAPPSKSFAHRYLISAYLSNKECYIRNVGNSKDVLATLGALKSLGAEYTILKDGVKIKRVDYGNGSRIVDCKESGSTMRFLMPVATALGISADFIGEGRLMERPIEKLTECLNAHGGKIQGHSVKGKLESGVYEIDASVSSQYISGLMFALPLLDGDSKIVYKNKLVSKGYLDVTEEVLKQFNIEVNKLEEGYFIKGGQRYEPSDLVVEGDFSGASFILSSGAINGKVTIKGLNAKTLQGDGEILEILKRFGAKVTVRENQITVESKSLSGIEVDIENIPDLAQIIAVLGAYANGKTVIKNISRLRLKESDRLKAITNMLDVAKIRYEQKENVLVIFGGNPIGGEFDGGLDHRTVMSTAILCLHANGDSIINGVEPIDKSYPEFFEDLIKLGGKVNVQV